MAKVSPWIGIQALHEQSIEEASAWWRNATEADKLAVWLAIQAMDGGSIIKVVSQFAQLGFEVIATKEVANGKM